MNLRPLLCLVVLLGFLEMPEAQARQPFFGSYEGSCDRTVPKAKPKKKKRQARATVVQNGPTNFDALATVVASGEGETLKISLELDANNTGTLTVNGKVIAGPVPKTGNPEARPRTLKIALKGTGSATFVGPLKQTLAFTGKAGTASFKATGVLDLDASGGLILDLKIVFTGRTALGSPVRFSFRGARD